MIRNISQILLKENSINGINSKINFASRNIRNIQMKNYDFINLAF